MSFIIIVFSVIPNHIRAFVPYLHKIRNSVVAEIWILNS